MKQEDKLREEVEFWLSYINDWEANYGELVPERAQTLLDIALSKLISFQTEKYQGEALPFINRLIH